MDNQQIKIRIGLACAGFLVATVILVMLFGGGKMPTIFNSDYEIYVLLKQAPMLNENSPVYKNGVEIGRVTRVELVNDDREVKITVRIRNNVKLYTDEECNLSLNLLGQSTLNFMPMTGEPLPGTPEPKVLEPKSTINGVTPIDIAKMADSLQNDATKALRSMSSVADQVQKSFVIINQILGSPEDVVLKQKRLEEMVDNLAKTMTAVNGVLGGVDKLVNNPDIQEGILASSRELPGIIDEGKKLIVTINGMTDSFKSMLKQVDLTIGKVDKNLENFTTFTEALGDNGPQFLEALASAAEEFDGSMEQLYAFTRSLNNPDGSVGQLLNDPEFFQMLKSTVKKTEQTSKNIERITMQLQPILQDVNVFTDKIARQPGLLGLKGMIDRSPPTKGIPDAYSYPWQYGRNNGIPHQQSERMQLLRPKSWPHGMPQYRNEPVPQQNRYASQVIDLPDSPYDDVGYYDYPASTEMYYAPSQPEPVAYPLSYQTPQIAPPNRVVIVPMQVERLQTSDFRLQKETRGVGRGTRDEEVLTPHPSPLTPHLNTLTLEIDFTPEASSSPVRLASGNALSPPPITQPIQRKTEQTAPTVVQTSGTISAKSKTGSEFNIPNFAPVF